MQGILDPELIKQTTKLDKMLKANYIECSKSLNKALSIRIENIRMNSQKFDVDLKFPTISINDEETIY